MKIKNDQTVSDAGLSALKILMHTSLIRNTKGQDTKHVMKILF